MGISASEFAYIRDLVHRRSAIVLEPGKEYLVEARLAVVAREIGAASLGELVTRLRAQPCSSLHGKVVEAPGAAMDAAIARASG